MDAKSLVKDIQFENDFGQSPVGLGLIIKDGGLVGLATVILAVLALPVGGSLGIPLAAAVAFIGANDCKALGKQSSGEAPLLETSPEVQEPPEEEATTDVTEDIDIPRLLASANSSVIMGAPRAGKGYAVAQALRMLPEGCTIWVLDPKNDPRELHYWSRVAPEYKLAFNNLTSDRPDDKTILEFITSFFDSAVKHGHHLLVIDEVPALSNMMSKAAFKKMMGLAASAASSGPSLGVNVWLITQDSTCEQMGFSAQSRACFAQFAVSSDRTPKSWLSGFCQSTKAPMPTVTGYIAYDGERWANSKQYPALPKGRTNRIPGSSAVANSNSGLNSNSNSAELALNSPELAGEFDPTQPESDEEFNQFRELVCKGLEAGSNELLTKMWGVKPGGSKRYQAARQRRDQFVARLSEYR